MLSVIWTSHSQPQVLSRSSGLSMLLRVEVLADLFMYIRKWSTAAGGFRCANWPIVELCLPWQLSKPVWAGWNKTAL